jgi:hypothetical protein
MPCLSESILNVALVATVFSSGITVYRERLFAKEAHEMVCGFSVDFIEMCVPPLIAAFIRTELLFLSAGNLDDCFPTCQARILAREARIRTATYVVPSAEGLYGIHRDTEQLTDFLIAKTLTPQRGNFCFFLYCHIRHPPLSLKGLPS